MSVSTDRIGATAMRCACLLSKIAERTDRPIDLTGADKIAEVYPAAALKVWADDAASPGLTWTGYKGERGRASRERILRALAAIAEPLAIQDADIDLCHHSDDALDALVCALVTRTAAIGLTHKPSRQHTEAASREGWIHVPEPGSLTRLQG
jgi:hypothetical protein